jgi:hypothetical protein
MNYPSCLRCGKGFGCVCNTPIRTLPHLEPATTQTVVHVDEKRLRAERRERIATACLASLLTHDGWEYFTPNHAARDALRYADALIEEIDKEAKP